MWEQPLTGIPNTQRQGAAHPDVEQHAGYEVCECGKYAYIYSAAILEALPDDYFGELCPECGLWMCAVDKLPKEM